MLHKKQLFGRLLAIDRLQEDIFGVISPNFSPVVLVHGIPGVGKSALCEHFLNLIRHQLIGVGDVVIISFKGAPQSPSTIAFSRLLLESIKRSRSQSASRARMDDLAKSRVDESDTSNIVNSYKGEFYSEDGAVYTDASAVDFLSADEEIELAQNLAKSLTYLLQKDYFMLGAEVRPFVVFILINLLAIQRI